MTENSPCDLLDHVAHNFSERVAQLRLSHFTAITAFQKEATHLEELSGELQEKNISFDKVVKGARQHFSDIGGSKEVLDLSKDKVDLVALAGQMVKGEEVYENIKLSLNHQLGWLLVSLFEAHERFLKDLYAAMGVLNPSLWAQKHFGNSETADLPSEDLDYYSQLVRKLCSHNCDPVVHQLRLALPRFLKFEQTKWVNRHCDHGLWRSIVELFRHLIVHQNGKAEEADFWKSVEKRTGRSLSSERESVLRIRAVIDSFLLHDEGNVRICVIENDIGLNTKKNLSHIDGPYRKLFEALLNWSFLAYREAITYFDEAPFWER